MNSRNKIGKQIQRYYGELIHDPHHRFRSWEHCYLFFSDQETPRSPAQLDIAALHLAFYLASWGMYRGSGALLWKDYKVHNAAVYALLDPSYAHLWKLSFDDPDKDLKIAKDIISLSKKLKDAYRQAIGTVHGKTRPFDASDTLISKILLGTLGCAPACDQYFIKGFRKQLSYSGFDEKFLCLAIDFYRQNGDDFKNVQDSIFEKGGVRYPVMKLIDMYFWEIGFKI